MPFTFSSDVSTRSYERLKDNFLFGVQYLPSIRSNEWGRKKEIPTNWAAARVAGWSRPTERRSDAEAFRSWCPTDRARNRRRRRPAEPDRSEYAFGTGTVRPWRDPRAHVVFAPLVPPYPMAVEAVVASTLPYRKTGQWSRHCGHTLADSVMLRKGSTSPLPDRPALANQPFIRAAFFRVDFFAITLSCLINRLGVQKVSKLFYKLTSVTLFPKFFCWSHYRKVVSHHVTEYTVGSVLNCFPGLGQAATRLRHHRRWSVAVELLDLGQLVVRDLWHAEDGDTAQGVTAQQQFQQVAVAPHHQVAPDGGWAW